MKRYTGDWVKNQMDGYGTMEWGFTGMAGEPWPENLSHGQLNFNIFENHSMVTVDSSLGEGILNGTNRRDSALQKTKGIITSTLDETPKDIGIY